MVPCSPIHANRLPETNNDRNGDNGKQGQLPDAPTISRMAHLRERYRSQQLSEEATDLMLSFWRASHMTRYLPNGITGVLNGVQIPFLVL